MAYSEKVIDHYENPRNVGSLTTRRERRQRHGGCTGLWRRDEVVIKVNDEGIIEDARFKTYGCGSAIASSSWSPNG